MKKIFILLTAFTMAACSTVIGQRTDATAIASGASRTDVRNALGSPTASYKNGGDDVWDYDYTRASFNFWYAVPFVGMFTNPYHYTRETSQFTFDDNGVKSVKTFKKSGSISSDNSLK